MNEILNRQWQNSNFPFNQDILYLPESIPFREFKPLLEATINGLFDFFGSKKLLYLEDWHNQDGYITQPSPVKWEELKHTVSSDGELYNLRGKDFDVYLAYFPESFDFFLRFRINDIFDDPRLSGISGIMDVTTGDEVLKQIEESLPENLADTCKREKSKSFFDRNFGG